MTTVAPTTKTPTESSTEEVSQETSPEMVQVPREEWERIKNTVDLLLSVHQTGGSRPTEAPAKIWLENLSDSLTRFKTGKFSYLFQPHGWEGSVLPVDPSLFNDPYLTRAVERERFRLLVTLEEAAQAREGLVEVGGGRTNNEQLTDYLGESATQTQRYTKAIPDEAESGESISAAAVWDGVDVAPKASGTVQKSITGDEFILTEPMIEDTEKGS